MATRGGGAANAAALLWAVWAALPPARSFSVPLQRPDSCGAGRYFDSSRLACAPCGAHQRQSAGGERGGGGAARARGRSGVSALNPPPAAGGAKSGLMLWR
ncbi:hypothetical protein WISP_01074 [Willisornis vidua]|uniref:Uncharacterized protein n=1 Tax=Willisornis vidua TaxID=1566151 RepID=A0ABQ9E0E4_9PASS|nr:hypothetical protein WISP_01074 [Willisornis vidua]